MDSAGGGLLAKRELSEKELERKSALLEAGNEAFDEDDLEPALRNYHQASLLDGSDPEVWCSLGLTYSNLGYPREAWRSYKLALQADPEHLNSLWYAGEFLFNQEDYELALPLLRHYLALEKDTQKLEEAKELIEELLALAPNAGKAAIDPMATSGIDAEGNELETEEDELEGFDFEGEDDADFEDEDYFDDDDDFGEDFQDGGRFQASLHLTLTGMQAKCAKCSVSIPEDAPYCYSCNAPHFYDTF